LSPTIGEAACVVPESASTIPAIDLKVASLPLDGRGNLVQPVTVKVGRQADEPQEG
jgi:hypothetical protein